MEIFAVIPARKGSKGIRRKNLRLLNGKPLIYYQIKSAMLSKYIKDIVITTDDEDIRDYVSTTFKSNFKKIFLRTRPLELSGDQITLDPVVYDAVTYAERNAKKRYDIVVTLQPTSPLLKVSTLDSAFKKFFRENLDSLISVVNATHLYWIENEGQIKPDYTERLNRQWLPKRYKETGAFLITKREYVNPNSRLGKKIGIYIMDETEGIDIDTPIDWIIAETLMKRLKILFIVNGNEKIGMGHIYRALTLSGHMLGHEIAFITYNSNENAIRLIQNHEYPVIITTKNRLLKEIAKISPNIIINDILDTDKCYIKKLKDMGLFVVNFEDLGDGADEAHLVFNALYEKTNPKPNHRFGYMYECLNEYFYLYPPIEFRNPPNTIFVCFGGVDQNNLTVKILKLVPTILEETSIKKIITVIGPGYQPKEKLEKILKQLSNVKKNIEIHKNVNNMPKLMKMSDIAITSNGRTIYELTVMGIPIISIAQNDRETLHLFARYHKGIKYLGMASNIKENDILKAIVDIATNKKIRKEMYLNQLKASKVLKKGTKRVLEEIFSEYWRWKDEENKNW